MAALHAYKKVRFVRLDTPFGRETEKELEYKFLKGRGTTRRSRMRTQKRETFYHASVASCESITIG